MALRLTKSVIPTDDSLGRFIHRPNVRAACRAATPADQAGHGITALPGLIVARYLGDSSEAARLWFAELWKILRPACCGRPAILPRIWNT